MCVLFTEDVGGAMMLEFAPDGTLEFRLRLKRRTISLMRLAMRLKVKAVSEGKAEAAGISGVILQSIYPQDTSGTIAGRAGGRRRRTEQMKLRIGNVELEEQRYTGPMAG